jgi:hypothetical protein
MATSGTVTYRITGDALLTSAIRLVASSDPENATPVTSNQLTYAREAANMILKAWQANGLQLWERRYGVIFPQPDQGVFVLGSPGPAGDHACLSTPLGVGGFVQTTLDDAAVSGATSIEVASLVSESTTAVSAITITDTYNIGIELDDGTVQWTTVSGAPSGSVVTLAASLTDDAAEGNNVFCYQTKLVRPLRILDAFVRQITGGNDSPVKLMAREHYNRFGYKDATGVVTQVYYDQQSNVGHLYVYPKFEDASRLLFIEFQSPIQDLTGASDDYDMPQEWFNALKFNLALAIAPEYEVSDSKFKQIQFLAAQATTLVDGWDQETSSLMLQPES